MKRQRTDLERGMEECVCVVREQEKKNNKQQQKV